MRNRIKIALISLFAVITLISIWLGVYIFTKPDFAYVSQSEWRYDSGFQIGDGEFLYFDANDADTKIEQDTIFYNGQRTALIKRTYPSHLLMVVESLNTKEKGIYRETGAHLEDENKGWPYHLKLILISVIY